MTNIYDYAYQLLDDIINEYNDQAFPLLMQFLTTDTSNLEIIFNKYPQLNKHYTKHVMMSIIFSHAYLTSKYDIVRGIDIDYAKDNIDFLEELSIAQIIQLFKEANSNIETIYEYFYKYVNNTYIYRYCCWQNILRENKMPIVLQLNPFAILECENISLELLFPETESTIQSFLNIYEKATADLLIELNLLGKIYPHEFNPLLIQNIHELTQEFFQNNMSEIFQFYLMILGNVYENIAISSSNKAKRQYKPLIKEIESLSPDELFNKLINEPNFALKIINLFLLYNNNLENGELITMHNKFIKLGKNNNLQKLNPYFARECQTLKRLKETSSL